MASFAPFRLPEYEVPKNAMLDFSPFSEAVKDYQTAKTNTAKLGMEQERLNLAKASGQREQESHEDQRKTRLAQSFAGIGQMILDEKDPVKQSEMYGRLVASDPRIKESLGKYLPKELLDDPVVASKYFVAQARGYVNPLDEEAKRAQIAASRAATAVSQEALNQKRNPNAVYDQRAAAAEKNGLVRGTREFNEFVLTGDFPKGGAGFKINEVGGKLVATDNAGNSKIVYEGAGATDPVTVKNITGGLTELKAIPGRYGGDSGAFGSGVGAFQGDDSSYIMAPIARALGSARQLGNPQSPSEARRAIQGAVDTLSSVIKPLIRKPGEGAWSDADEAKLQRIVGNLTMANDQEQYNRELDNVRQRINANFGIELPELFPKKPDAPKAGTNAAPQSQPSARKSVGGRNFVKIDGNWYEE
jgi:hypothetical protein